jgi:hypothetical protein
MKRPMLGLAGLIVTGLVGCETNRPYCDRCMSARTHLAQSEAPYRPKTVVTMRADEVPERPADAHPAVQVVNDTGVVTAQISAPTGDSHSMVTVTIPAMKITVPMTAVMQNPAVSGKETGTVTQLPSVDQNVIQTSNKTLVSSPKTSKAAEEPVHQAAHAQKEESAASAKTQPVPVSEQPPPEPKPVGKAAASGFDGSRPPKLSLLPPEPPEISVHHASPAAPGAASALPPPPPPIPKAPSSAGPALPSEDSDSK